MTTKTIDPVSISKKLKNVDLKYDLYFCQLIYEDIEGCSPFLDIEICKKCYYNESERKVIFEDGQYLNLNRYIRNDKFVMVKYKSDPYYQIHYCGLFYGLEDIKQSISILSHQFSKCFDNIIVKEM